MTEAGRGGNFRVTVSERMIMAKDPRSCKKGFTCKIIHTKSISRMLLVPFILNVSFVTWFSHGHYLKKKKKLEETEK